MGVNLRDLIPDSIRVETDVKGLKGNTIALDAYNTLYQFLAAIRQPDGTPLMDRMGRVTSHLSGLFYRTINLAEEGVRPVYVFDGEPPRFKAKELEERARRREQAEAKLAEARTAGLVEEARKYAQQAIRLSSGMVEEAKKLLEAMGIPWVQAPGEGEAQAAYMARRGDAWAAGSQDYDSLLFGSTRLVRNLAITGRRKLPGKDLYVEVKPEVIELSALLKNLGITREQLIAIGIILGTDYNEGAKGIGPKRALNIVKSIGDPLKAIKAAGVREPWIDEVYNYFLNPPVTSDYTITFNPPNEREINRILVEEHDFNPDRVAKAVDRLKKAYRENLKAKQSRLDAWFS
ncbi:MAG: flap endonuclease-1 [Desulfurococcales archaeon]|nr:flap endonuclease-1 [Desulfurococcales archaeon]